jgi:predicted amidophosphoribosyltransferase
MIAAAVAAELGVPLVHCLARRTGRRQVGRDRASRLADPPRIRAAGDPPASVLLVDDVLTTGATLAACAAALQAAGCADMSAGVLARALGATAAGA